MTSLFETVELAPRDPILGLNEQYNADERSGKVNLGVGVYYDDQGRIPILQAVQKQCQPGCFWAAFFTLYFTFLYAVNMV